MLWKDLANVPGTRELSIPTLGLHLRADSSECLACALLMAPKTAASKAGAKKAAAPKAAVPKASPLKAGRDDLGVEVVKAVCGAHEMERLQVEGSRRGTL